MFNKGLLYASQKPSSEFPYKWNFVNVSGTVRNIGISNGTSTKEWYAIEVNTPITSSDGTKITIQRIGENIMTSEYFSKPSYFNGMPCYQRIEIGEVQVDKPQILVIMREGVEGVGIYVVGQGAEGSYNIANMILDTSADLYINSDDNGKNVNVTIGIAPINQFYFEVPFTQTTDGVSFINKPQVLTHIFKYVKAFLDSDDKYHEFPFEYETYQIEEFESFRQAAASGENTNNFIFSPIKNGDYSKTPLASFSMCVIDQRFLFLYAYPKKVADSEYEFIDTSGLQPKITTPKKILFLDTEKVLNYALNYKEYI